MKTIFKNIRLKLLFAFLLVAVILSSSIIKARYMSNTQIKKGITYNSLYFTSKAKPLEVKKFDPGKFDSVSFLTFIRIKVTRAIMMEEEDYIMSFYFGKMVKE